jgi:hypothetical protein
MFGHVQLIFMVTKIGMITDFSSMIALLKRNLVFSFRFVVFEYTICCRGSNLSGKRRCWSAADVAKHGAMMTAKIGGIMASTVVGSLIDWPSRRIIG